MRILKNRALAARWHDEGWDRTLAGPLPAPTPALLALVGAPLAELTRGVSVDVGEAPEPQQPGHDACHDANATFLVAAKAAFALARRLEPEGAFRVLVRRDSGTGRASVKLRCFRRDESHPDTPDQLRDVDESAWVLFVDTRRIDGARRPEG